MPLDIEFVFTANPEDYTNRGSIITPLKDRIESQIFDPLSEEYRHFKADYSTGSTTGGSTGENGHRSGFIVQCAGTDCF